MRSVCNGVVLSSVGKERRFLGGFVSSDVVVVVLVSHAGGTFR